MQKENIIINSIIPIYETTQWIGQEPTTKQMGLRVDFDYKSITGCEIKINTPVLIVEEIKDRIIEVLG